ncbi:monofunctional biosynthetic peptidoglycan transglycosylase [Pelistega europaea]|uniref:Biosynthetic peptidoglycan transglycosylase n=1 Tax=Pelistega europaea TaxID=106147 RepID=A0A7Y4LAI7_9BURK|nr:monofunctional biosynthetic peptidoglycan transglycosylase [Pelistega europaea]NOL49959.1 monofunctional biosynthetic peptidoglycan transglycosylase [Pelistega europaea]
MTDIAQAIIDRPFRTCLWYSCIGLVAILFAYQIFLFSNVVLYALVNPSSTAFMRYQSSQLKDKEILFQWVDYAKMSNSIKRAVIASEDSGFTEHFGVEWGYIKKAFQYNLRQSENQNPRIRGGSTLTQQLAKNLFLSPSRSYLRKAQELIITYMLETILSKKRILELYLNTSQFGESVFGIGAASQFYFKKPAQMLSNAEAARLAVLLPNPDDYGRRFRSAYLNRRTSIILRRMPLVEIPK